MHLVGICMTSITKMHGTMNIKYKIQLKYKENNKMITLENKRHEFADGFFALYQRFCFSPSSFLPATCVYVCFSVSSSFFSSFQRELSYTQLQEDRH